MNYPEYFTEEFHPEFHYDSAHKVTWGGYKKYCFANYNSHEPFFILKSLLSPELTEKYLKKLTDEYPIKMDVNGDIIKFHTNWSFNKTIILGNLCKGISEFAFFCGLQMLKYPDLPFFEGNRLAFEEVGPGMVRQYGYNPEHGWWNGVTYHYDDDKITFKEDLWKTKTIKEALKLLPKFKEGHHKKRWDICMNRE